jgi:glycosyltransferase involved in cell wall biosynthesis
MIGSESTAYESRSILREVSRLEAEGCALRWRGQVSESDLHKSYADSTFSVFPSLMEGFGLPIVESLWHGRPVICSDKGAVGEISAGAGVLTTNVSSEESLTGAIRSLLTNDSYCAALAEQAYQRPVRTWKDYWIELERHL